MHCAYAVLDSDTARSRFEETSTRNSLAGTPLDILFLHMCMLCSKQVLPQMHLATDC